MKKKKEVPLFISEENKMDKEMMSKFNNSTDSKPVIEMKEEESMPLYMFMAPFVSNLGSTHTNMDLMMTIIHLKKEKKIEIRGRMRYEDTGRKTVFTLPLKLKINQITKAKEVIMEFYTGMVKDLPFIPTKEPFELEFELNEGMESVIKKMNDSNQFDIGKIEKK